jgi:hypothetical protein
MNGGLVLWILGDCLEPFGFSNKYVGIVIVVFYVVEFLLFALGWLLMVFGYPFYVDIGNYVDIILVAPVVLFQF